AQGIVRAFIWLNLYLVCVLPINWLLDANYFYLMHKPQVPSLLDFFGPWPFYLVVTETLAMLFFALSYLPFFFVRKLRSKQGTMDGESRLTE
ncbi:YwaF family protein, partial [Porticoccaceae bacterium]|nr:YwaF family protein [Porticoccaceae bacterium]